MLGAFYAFEKDLLREYHYRLLKCFELAQRTTDAELCVLLSKRRMGLIQRDFGLENYMLSLTMETFVAMK